MSQAAGLSRLGGVGKNSATTSAATLRLSGQVAADGIMKNGLGAAMAGEAVAGSGTEVMVNQMTALSAGHVGTLILDVPGGQVHAIAAVDNPGKLRQMGPVAGGWAVTGEANPTHRPADRASSDRCNRSGNDA